MAKSNLKTKKSKSIKKTLMDITQQDIEEQPSPKLIFRDNITSHYLSPNYSLEAPHGQETMMLVAQEVSWLLMQLFDKKLEVLHISINSAMALSTTNVEVENRLILWKCNL